jgi:hypothetical protein
LGYCPSSLATRQSTNWFGSAAAIYDAYQKVLPKRKEKLFEEEKEQVETEIPADLFFAEQSDLEVDREGLGV